MGTPAANISFMPTLPGVIPSEVEGSWLRSNMGTPAGNISFMPTLFSVSILLAPSF